MAPQENPAIFGDADATRFEKGLSEVYDQIVYAENEIDWKQELKRWIAAANRKKLMMTIQK